MFVHHTEAPLTRVQRIASLPTDSDLALANKVLNRPPDVHAGADIS
jgi:hypothetical protein